MERVVARDGMSLPVHRSGKGRPIVFLHGWAIGAQAFADAHQRLRDHAQIITFDQRGLIPDHPPSSPTIELLARDLEDVLVELDLTDVTLVGWSMGSLVAWLALLQPRVRRRVTAMVSIDMTPRVTNDASWQFGFSDGRGAEDMLRTLDIIRSDWPRMVEVLKTKIYSPGYEPDPALQQALFEPVAALDPNPLAAIWQSMAVQDLRRDMARLDVPMLLLHGAESQLYCLESGHYLKRAMPQAALHIFQHSGHAPHLEEPDQFYDLLLDFHINHLGTAEALPEYKKVSNHQGGYHA